MPSVVMIKVVQVSRVRAAAAVVGGKRVVMIMPWIRWIIAEYRSTVG